MPAIAGAAIAPARRKRLGLAEDRRRVQAAADRHRNGIHRATPARDGFLQMAAECLDVFAERAIAQPPPRIEIPVAPPREASWRHGDDVSRHDRCDALKARQILTVERPCANQHEIGDPFVVGPRCDVRMREQRLDLGAEREETRRSGNSRAAARRSHRARAAAAAPAESKIAMAKSPLSRAANPSAHFSYAASTQPRIADSDGPAAAPRGARRDCRDGRP